MQFYLKKDYYNETIVTNQMLHLILFAKNSKQTKLKKQLKTSQLTNC